MNKGMFPGNRAKSFLPLFNNNPGAWSWSAPFTGLFQVTICGGGGSYRNDGFAGTAGTPMTRMYMLKEGEVLWGVIGKGGAYLNQNGTETRLYYKNHAVWTAAGGVTGAQGLYTLGEPSVIGRSNEDDTTYSPYTVGVNDSGQLGGIPIHDSSGLYEETTNNRDNFGKWGAGGSSNNPQRGGGDGFVHITW